MSGNIFINYRREDSRHPAGRLYDCLKIEFGSDKIFIDIDDIAPGADFTKVLSDQVSQCDVMISILGPDWIGIKDNTTGQRRLENSEDFVRIEIESALERNIPIIPVLVDDASMPSENELPESLKSFSRRNAMRLTHERFISDSTGLIDALKEHLTRIETIRIAENEQIELARLEKEKEARQKAEEDERQRQELARVRAMAELSPEEITRAEELARWDFVKTSSKTSDFINFLELYPNGKMADIAFQKLEALTWKQIENSSTLEPFEIYMKNFPDGKFLTIAKVKINEIQENLAWLDFEEKGTVEGYQEFIGKWPDSKKVDTAHRNIELLEEEQNWKRLISNKDLEGYREYIKTYPEGNFAEEAQLQINELEINEKVRIEEAAKAIKELQDAAAAKVAEERLRKEKNLQDFKSILTILVFIGIISWPIFGLYSCVSEMQENSRIAKEKVRLASEACASREIINSFQYTGLKLSVTPAGILGSKGNFWCFSQVVSVFGGYQQKDNSMTFDVFKKKEGYYVFIGINRYPKRPVPKTGPISGLRLRFDQDRRKMERARDMITQGWRSWRRQYCDKIKCTQIR